ncbi:MAG: 30S ribosomal protein S14 [Candidatus Aenigmatarchaeota archaeon]
MSFLKVRKQIEKKPIKVARYDKFNKPKKRKFGKNIHRCAKCNRTGGMINKYDLHYCRQCFREQAEKLGFVKYS